MRITVNIDCTADCTPDEARAFLGLPDVRTMPEALMREVQVWMNAGLKALEPEEMLKLWLPGATRGPEQWQELLAIMAGSRPRA